MTTARDARDDDNATRDDAYVSSVIGKVTRYGRGRVAMGTRDDDDDDELMMHEHVM